MRLLDLCCGAGGAARGYSHAGFEVVGVDIVNQPDYPFEFHRADALEYLVGNSRAFDVIHTSPPCQRWTHGNAANVARLRHPDLIGAHRQQLRKLGKPYVIENVPRAPLIDPMVLCGTMFNLVTLDDDGTLLYLRRHRHFESSVQLSAPGRCVHPPGVQWAGAYGGARRDKIEARHVRKGGYVPTRPVIERLLGIEWMTERGLFQAIPPAYTEYIGRALLETL